MTIGVGISQKKNIKNFDNVQILWNDPYIDDGLDHPPPHLPPSNPQGGFLSKSLFPIWILINNDGYVLSSHVPQSHIKTPKVRKFHLSVKKNQVDSLRKVIKKSTMFSENIINLTCCTII